MDRNQYLLILAQEGDKTAFEKLYGNLYTDLYRFTYIICKNKEDTVRIIVNTITRVFSSLHTFCEIDDLTNNVYENICCDLRIVAHMNNKFKSRGVTQSEYNVLDDLKFKEKIIISLFTVAHKNEDQVCKIMHMNEVEVASVYDRTINRLIHGLNKEGCESPEDNKRKKIDKKSKKQDEINNKYDRYKQDSLSYGVENEGEKDKKSILTDILNMADKIQINEELRPEKILEKITNNLNDDNFLDNIGSKSPKRVFYPIRKVTLFLQKVQNKLSEKTKKRIKYIFSIFVVIYCLSALIFVMSQVKGRNISFRLTKITESNKTQVGKVTDQIKPANSKEEIIATIRSSQYAYYTENKNNQFINDYYDYALSDYYSIANNESDTWCNIKDNNNKNVDEQPVLGGKIGDRIFCISKDRNHIDIINIQSEKESIYEFCPDTKTLNIEAGYMIYDYYCVNDQLYIIYSDQNLEINNQMLEGNENSGSNLSIDSESDTQSGIETQNKKTYVLIYSFENGETPQLDRSLEIDGSYNKSIKIEDRLIVLTNKFFSIGMEYVNKKATMHLEKQRNLPCINGKELEYKSIYITNSNNLCSYLLITSIDTKSDRKDNTNYKCIALLGSTKHININDNDLYIFMNKECDQEKSDPANSKDNTKIIKLSFDKDNYKPLLMTEVDGSLTRYGDMICEFADKDFVFTTDSNKEVDKLLQTGVTFFRMDRGLNIKSTNNYRGTIYDCKRVNNQIYFQTDTLMGENVESKSIDLAREDLQLETAKDIIIANIADNYIYQISDDLNLVITSDYGSLDRYMSSYYNDDEDIKKYSKVNIQMIQNFGTEQKTSSGNLQYEKMVYENYYDNTCLYVNNENKLIGVVLVDEEKRKYTYNGTGDAVYILFGYNENGMLEQLYSYTIENENLQFDDFTGTTYASYIDNNKLYILVPGKGLQVVDLQNYSNVKFINYENELND